MTFAMEKFDHRNFQLAKTRRLIGISFAFLYLMQAVSSSCDYNPSEIKFETLRLSVGLPSNFTELRFRAFVGISLAGCEKECGLRRQCRVYTYHRIMHLCELFDIELDVNELNSWVTRHDQSVLRRMDDLTRQVSIDHFLWVLFP